MDLRLKEQFLTRWREYFTGAELPLTFQYTDNGIQADPALYTTREKCMIHMLQHVREGKSLRFFSRSFGCGGAKFNTGFAESPRADIAEFLSCGIQDQLRGERYKKDPEMAAAAIGTAPWYESPHAHMVFKRWDKLDEHDEPEIIIFFARPDALSGLFMLAGYDEPKLENIVIAPHGSGCASIIQYPYVEKLNGTHRAVLGMFDPTARVWIGSDCLTFTVTMERFRRMVENMSESFLVAPAWHLIRKRIRKCELVAE